ncbi:MAG TPA: LacI family DNA-binding transcriptional regulator [Tepidisphaeraceae bacterium]|nr:LacI family DNA-binding transcriptional regulator [Tepidisphaeraceae bacterium]
MGSRPTITDVARLCGVTPATVSRVLNGKKKFSTSEAVREKIIATARKIGYVPDLAARNLNRGTTHIIGLFASPQTHVAEGINEALLEGLAQALHAGGYDVFFELSPTATQDRALPFWRFDGAILLQAPKRETVLELDRRRVPYVCVNERVGNPVATVIADDAMGMNRVLDHLAQLGHKRLAYANARATYFSHYSVTERYETLLTGARKRSLHLVDGHENPFSSATEFLEESVVKGKATAVVTYDHHIAVAIVGAAGSKGLKIPDDFSLVCFNDVFPVSMLPPPLTAVAVSGRDMGRIGADLLLNSLVTDRPYVAREIRVAEDLIVRASTAAPKN